MAAPLVLPPVQVLPADTPCWRTGEGAPNPEYGLQLSQNNPAGYTHLRTNGINNRGRHNRYYRTNQLVAANTDFCAGIDRHIGLILVRQDARPPPINDNNEASNSNNAASVGSNSGMSVNSNGGKRRTRRRRKRRITRRRR
jgi:hypothetical protein